jgi:hypothetical protein
MQLFHIFTMLLVLGVNASAYAQEQQSVPDQVYQELDYMLSLSQSEVDLEPEKLSGLVNFIHTTPPESSMTLKARQGASGAFHAFSLQGDLPHVLDYAYNPDIPIYVTMPSSLHYQEWLTPQTSDGMRNLPRKVDSAGDIRLLRGRDRESITPDTNTGGYYLYNQDRVMTILPGPAGPVLISASSQTEPSEVGKKGCVVGDDKNWNYLYSDQKGLNKTGLGWVSSYMYQAYSVIIYVADSSTNTVHVGSFKWLNAGWAKINMVKSSHILNGIKRFASDFKAVLESPGLPEPSVLADKYRELQQSSEQVLRQQVSQYLQAMSGPENEKVCSSPFKDLVSSGEYLQQMSRGEMVKVLLLEYIKACMGKEPLVGLASPAEAFAARP